jgi:hypothetical protein
MVANYVKKGNLNKRFTEKLPNVDFRIEYYRITQRGPSDY